MKNKTRIILTGAQCTGKTTLMKELAKDGTRTLSIARETAERFGWTPDYEDIEGYQNALFADMLKGLSSKKSYISDRGLTDVAAHTFAGALAGRIKSSVADKQYLKMHKFHRDNPDILVVYVPIEFEIEDDGVRNIDKADQAKMDFLIKNLLDTAGISYITVTGTVEERISQIENELSSR